MPTVQTPLRDIAKVVRSKNAGPFEITLDIIFKNREDFDAVKKSGVKGEARLPAVAMRPG